MTEASADAMSTVESPEHSDNLNEMMLRERQVCIMWQSCDSY